MAGEERDRASRKTLRYRMIQSCAICFGTRFHLFSSLVSCRTRTPRQSGVDDQRYFWSIPTIAAFVQHWALSWHSWITKGSTIPFCPPHCQLINLLLLLTGHDEHNEQDVAAQCSQDHRLGTHQYYSKFNF